MGRTDMRRIVLLAGLLCLALCHAAQARDIALTIYDDGMSCPAGCDAHVVLNARENGTVNAFSAGSSRTSPQPCRNGELCNICFSDAADSCMQAIYRGGGPPAGKFDFTPAFYDQNCSRSDIPAALRRQCSALDRAVRDNGYQNATNCFANAAAPGCAALMAEARRQQEADRPEREKCLSLGEASYNRQQADPNKRRANSCNYTQAKLGGPNANGVRWRKLMPGACREGTFVGRDGLDCCSTSVRFAASVQPECRRFFPRP
jgi:hypothetical protein